MPLVSDSSISLPKWRHISAPTMVVVIRTALAALLGCLIGNESAAATVRAAFDVPLKPAPTARAIVLIIDVLRYGAQRCGP